MKGNGREGVFIGADRFHNLKILSSSLYETTTHTWFIFLFFATKHSNRKSNCQCTHGCDYRFMYKLNVEEYQSFPVNNTSQIRFHSQLALGNYLIP